MRVPIYAKIGFQPWWGKFLDDPDNQITSAESINQRLKPYRAKLVYDPYVYKVLEFDTEQDYVMFLLRWS